MSFSKAIMDPEVTRLRDKLNRMLEVPRPGKFRKAMKRALKEMQIASLALDKAFKKHGVKVEVAEDLAKKYEDAQRKEIATVADGEEAAAGVVASKSQAKRVRIQKAA